MKAKLLASLMLLAILFSVISCKDGGSSSKLPPVSGATNEIMLIMNKALWTSPVGDSIKTYFEQPQFGLPQPEPIFNIVNLPLASFDKNVKSHRNVLIVEISNRIDSASLDFKDSPWARNQKYFKITASSDSAFFKIFDANKDRIMNTFLKAEKDRLVDVYKKNPDSKIFRLFKDKYNILLSCPGGYIINKDTNNFVWISSETRVDSKGIIFFQERYENTDQLEHGVILARVNEELKKYIPASLKNSWMTLDMVTPMNMTVYNYDGVYYSVMIKGLWTTENDFMGGPFVLNVVVDEQSNRLIYMMGYVYAPDGKKRNMLRQVESILFTMQLNYDKAGDQPVDKPVSDPAEE